MRRLWPVLLLVGCARVPPAEPECTFSTPLTPGVPGSPGHLIASQRNPNGDSELAALMRTMQSDLEAARPGVLAGRAPPPMRTRYRKLRCSWPTAAEDRNATFDSLAQNYLTQVERLDARPKDLGVAYDAVVEACRACHLQACPGPIAAIDLLKRESASPVTPSAPTP